MEKSTQCRNVHEFLNRVRDVYKKARAGYVNLYNQLDAHDEKWKSELARGWSNERQKAADEARYNERKAGITKQLETLISDTYAELDKIQAEADNVFGAYDRATPDKLDMSAVELLKSGILRADEYKALADGYKDNCAMLRLIGKYAHEHGKAANDTELKAYGKGLINYRFPYREPIEKLIDSSKRNIRLESPNPGLNVRKGSEIRDKLYYDNEFEQLMEQTKDTYITIEHIFE